MSSNVIAISGWGQAHDALASVVPAGTFHFDYSSFAGVDECFDVLRERKCDVLIGWSLGGQLALRAISEGVLKPGRLVLLATPYQFVASKDFKCAMDHDTFEIFLNNFKHDPGKTLKRFLTLISRNDAHAHDILARLRHDTNTENLARWGYWLEELENFSCNSIDFSLMPSTIAFHGRDDTLVDCTQTGFFRSLIPGYSLEVFEKCGHAPHLHDEAKVRTLINSVL